MSALPWITDWQTWLDMPVENSKSQPGLACLNWRHRRVTVGMMSRGMVCRRRVPTPSRSIWKCRQAAVSQGYNLLGLGEQGGAVPAQGNPPAAFLKQGDPQLLLQGRGGVAETGL